MSEDSSKAKRFSLFKKASLAKKAGPEEPREVTFDETTFDFTLTGGPFQTTLIQASAKVKTGPSGGMPLPLKCTWYRAPSNVDFQQIEGVSGAFYQPNADDVGCKINVHAVPVSEVEDYTGMPAFAEVGPLQLDPKIQKAVDDMLKSSSATFTIKVLASENLPSLRSTGLAVLSIDQHSLRVSLTPEESVDVETVEEYPQVRMSPYPSTNIDILLSPTQKLICEEDSSELRDTVAVTLRAFAAIRMGDTGRNTNSDSLLRIQQLTESLTKAARERESASTQMNIAREKEAEARKERDDLRIEFEALKANREREIHSITEQHSKENHENVAKIDTLEQQKLQLTEQLDSLTQKCAFLKQDIGLYKSQMADFEQRAESSVAKLNSLKLLNMGIREKVMELKGKKSCHGEAWEELLEMVANNSDQAEGSRSSSKTSSIKSGQVREEQGEQDRQGAVKELQGVVAVLRAEEEKRIAELAAAQEQILQVEAERNFFKKKCESLTRENDHLLSDLGKNPKALSEFERQKEIFISEKEAILKELVQARELADIYKSTMEVTQRKLEQEIHRNVEIRKHLKPKEIKAGPQAFQNIINALTETLTDREVALQDQKDVNRGLMNRVTELEAIVLGLSQKM